MAQKTQSNSSSAFICLALDLHRVQYIAPPQFHSLSEDGSGKDGVQGELRDDAASIAAVLKLFPHQGSLNWYKTDHRPPMNKTLNQTYTDICSEMEECYLFSQYMFKLGPV